MEADVGASPGVAGTRIADFPAGHGPLVDTSADRRSEGHGVRRGGLAFLRQAVDPSENVDDDGRRLYLDVADLGRHLEHQVSEGDTAEFPAVLELIERLHVEGDPWVKELATIGILEALNPDERFIPWLGAGSLDWWQRLDRFWSGDIHALNEDLD